MRRLTRVFETALSNIAGPPAIFHLVAGDYFWIAAAYSVCRRLYPCAKINIHLGNPPVFLVPTYLERKAFRDADSASFVSKDTRKAWEKSLGFALSHARVLRTPITTDTIPFIERGNKSANEPFILLTLGRLSPIKGVDIALQAVRQLRNNGFNVSLWILGVGPDEMRFRRIADELGLTEHAKFHGFVSEPAGLFPQIDFLLQPSTHTEGIPNSVLEAMASGMPVIASRVGGLPEIIADKQTGMLVDPGNPQQIADSVAELIRNAELRSRISREGSEYVRKNYSAAMATASLARLFESLASGTPATATQVS
jgi:glycosyltransferase involved in cell wall biosynthesis